MNIEFREPMNQQELAGLFDFRQAIYARSESLKTMVQKNDITHFDERAFHFAAYHENKPVAYMRMVQLQKTKFAAWVQSITAEINNSDSENLEFPFQHYSPDKDWNKFFLNRLQHKKIGEAGKLAIAEHVRSDQFLSRFVQSFLDYCIHQNGFHSGFGICTLELERFYKRLGFFRPEGAQPFTHSSLPLAVMVQFDAVDLVQSQ